MNLLDANSVVSTLGLIGVLGIIFMETGLLIGLVFPGGEVVFLAGIAASGSGAAALGDAKLSTPLLFTLAPIAAIVGGEVGYWFGKKFGRPFFDRPESRFFNQKMVAKVEKYLATYGPRKALVFGRFIPFARTLINPVCGVANLERRLFSTWNAIGAIICTNNNQCNDSDNKVITIFFKYITQEVTNSHCNLRPNNCANGIPG